jgi:hypothetical protein
VWSPDRLSDETIQLFLGQTQRLLGVAPEAADVHAAFHENPHDLQLERWLFEWEIAHGSATNPKLIGQSSTALFSVEIGFGSYLCLLPTAAAWQVPGRIYYMGAERRLPEFCGAVRRWESQYDAKLALIGNVSAEFSVGRPPSDLDDAWQLALEHVVFGHSSSGPLRWLAASLLSARSWWLFERP